MSDHDDGLPVAFCEDLHELMAQHDVDPDTFHAACVASATAELRQRLSDRAIDLQRNGPGEPTELDVEGANKLAAAEPQGEAYWRAKWSRWAGAYHVWHYHARIAARVLIEQCGRDFAKRVIGTGEGCWTNDVPGDMQLDGFRARAESSEAETAELRQQLAEAQALAKKIDDIHVSEAAQERRQHKDLLTRRCAEAAELRAENERLSREVLAKMEAAASVARHHIAAEAEVRALQAELERTRGELAHVEGIAAGRLEERQHFERIAATSRTEALREAADIAKAAAERQSSAGLIDDAAAIRFDQGERVALAIADEIRGLTARRPSTPTSPATWE